jgi:hypothetical protein
MNTLSRGMSSIISHAMAVVSNLPTPSAVKNAASHQEEDKAFAVRKR